jgi:hypothetical protein
VHGLVLPELHERVNRLVGQLGRHERQRRDVVLERRHCQSSLRGQYPAPALSAAFQAAGIGPKTVVAFVSPAQWVQLFGVLDHRS